MMITVRLVFLSTITLLNFSYSQNNIWMRTNDLQDEYITGLVVNSAGDIFAGSYHPGKIFRSVDNGNSWTHLVDLPTIWSLAINDSQHVFAATLGGEGIYRSIDNGDTWQPANQGLTQNSCNNLAFSDSGYVFAATDYGMYNSSDNGDNWVPINSGLPATLMYDVCVATNGHVFVGTYDMGIYRSIDNGLTWEERNIGLTNPFIWSLLYTRNGILFSGPDASYVERSLDEGNNWAIVSNGLPNTWFFHVLEENSEGTIFVGFESEHGVYRSDDNGNTWTAYNSGFPAGIQVASLFVNQDDILFAGTINGVYRTVNPTTMIVNYLTIPLEFYLEQNYPNPFNQTTTIYYYLREPANVELDLFDLNGKEVATIFQGQNSSGRHSVKYDASNLASGIYICRMNAKKEFTNTIKLLLLK